MGPARTSQVSLSCVSKAPTAAKDGAARTHCISQSIERHFLPHWMRSKPRWPWLCLRHSTMGRRGHSIAVRAEAPLHPSARQALKELK